MEDVKIHYTPDDYTPSMLNKAVVFNKKCKYYTSGGGIDTESTTITHKEKDKTIVDYCFCYMFQVSISNHVFLLRTEGDLYKLLHNMITQRNKTVTTVDNKRISTKNVKTILYCANLSHEYSFLKNMFNKFNITKFFCRNKRNILLIELENFIEIRECIGLFGNSLSKIAEDYCTTQKLKGDLDYSLIRTCETVLTKKELQYCINDVVILSELYEYTIREFLVKTGKMILTETGIIRNECKNKIKKIKSEIRSNNDLIIDERTYNLIRNYGYNGGLCGSNPDFVNKIIENEVKCADVTSDYPYQMNSHMFPSGMMIKSNNLYEDFKKCTYEKKCYYAVFNFGEIETKTQHATINKDKIVNNDVDIIKLSNNKIVKAKNITLCMNEVDLQAFKLMYSYKKCTLKELYYFTKKSRCGKHILETMNYYYKLKNELKTKGLSDTLEYKQAKARVNSVYGMTVTRLYKENYEFDNECKQIVKNVSTWEDMRKNNWLNCFIGFYTTSYARLLLCMFISKYNDLIVQYDTDSLYFICNNTEKSKELQSEIKNFNMRITAKNKRIFSKDFEYFSTLGTWDIDNHCYKKFIALGAKKYVKYDDEKGLQVTIAGLPENSFNKMMNTENITIDELFFRLTKIHEHELFVKNEYCCKLASVYSDTSEYEIAEITDYQGNVSLQGITCYHALINVDFTLDIDKTLKSYIASMKLENIKHISADYKDFENIVSIYLE